MEFPYLPKILYPEGTGICALKKKKASVLNITANPNLILVTQMFLPTFKAHLHKI